MKQNPNDPSAYNVRGTAYGKAGDLSAAIADFDTAIKLNPSFYQAYANRALVERRQGHDDLAFNDYNKAIAIDPNYAPAYVGRGNMYRQRKQNDLALADFNNAIKLDPPTRAPTTIAAWSSRPRASTRRPSPISPRRSRSPRPPSSPTTRAASPISPPRTTRPRSTTSTRWSSATGIPTRAGPTRASRSRSSATPEGLRRLRPRHTLNPGYAPAREGMRRTAGAQSGRGGMAVGNNNG